MPPVKVPVSGTFEVLDGGAGTGLETSGVENVDEGGSVLASVGEVAGDGEVGSLVAVGGKVDKDIDCPTELEAVPP